MNAVFQKLKSAQRHIEKSEDPKSVLPKPPKVAFRNSKILKDKLVELIIRISHLDNLEKGVFSCGKKELSNISHLVKEGSTFTGTSKEKII